MSIHQINLYSFFVCVFARNKLSETRKNKNGDIIIQGESLLKQAGVKIKGCWMGLEKKKERFTSFFFLNKTAWSF